MQPKLGIIAGGGDLPVRIIEACRRSGRPHFVLAFEGQTPLETVEGAPHAWVRLGAGGKALKILKKEDVKELVLAGPVRRPSLSELKPDLWTAKFLAKVSGKALGDDGLLGAVVRELEAKEGFVVVGAESLLPNDLAAEGVLGDIAPDTQALLDIERGVEVARGLCALDVGQAAVVQQGMVLAVEALEGTDAMIARAGSLQREGLGGVLVKVGVDKQENRADLPAVGESTVRAAAAAGLRGIAVEAGGALVIDHERMLSVANHVGLFVVGVRV
ncbi:MAG: UDP-2,3-diacylglucosamine diphosphatase LpxI [Rhodospirillales bacterium]|nr:UDP-2,3-diacylglucosamine diphosphatase LpxI [Rhodospirillales bacterium]